MAHTSQTQTKTGASKPPSLEELFGDLVRLSKDIHGEAEMAYLRFMRTGDEPDERHLHDESWRLLLETSRQFNEKARKIGELDAELARQFEAEAFRKNWKDQVAELPLYESMVKLVEVVEGEDGKEPSEYAMELFIVSYSELTRDERKSLRKSMSESVSRALSDTNDESQMDSIYRAMRLNKLIEASVRSAARRGRKS